MAKERVILYTQKVVNDPSNAQAARVLEQKFRDIETAAKAATKAIREANEASNRSANAARGGGGRGGSSGGGRGYSSFAAGMSEGSRILAAERREREAALRDMQRAAEQEKNILRDRVRANIEASRQIRDAAKTTRANFYRGRAAASAAASSASAAYGAAGQAAYAAGDGFSDADAKRHVEALGRAHAETERAAVRSAQRAAQANRELFSGLKQTAAGVGSVARAFVYLGISGEENLAKAVQMLAKFEAGMAGIQGVSNIAAGGTKAIRAYRGMGAGAGLAAGVGAVGIGTTALAGGAALAVGGGIGFGIGRLAIGGASFGRMTDNWGITDYAGEHRARNAERVRGLAGQWNAQRSGIDQRYADFSTMQDINLQHAQITGGADAVREQASKNRDIAFAQNREVNARITANPGMAREVATRELANANAAQIQAMSTVLTLRQQDMSLLNQAIAAEKQRTQAIKDQQQAIRASIGMADAGTLSEAEAGAKAIREGRQLTQSQVSALGAAGFGETSQQEAAKLGENALSRFPELRALADQLKKNAEEASKKIDIAIQQSVTGRITVTPDLEKTRSDLMVVLKQWSSETVELVKKQIELDRADRQSQSDLQRNTSG